MSAARKKPSTPSPVNAPAPRVLAFAEELARLYADLWVDGKLEDLRKDPQDAEDE